MLPLLHRSFVQLYQQLTAANPQRTRLLEYLEQHYHEKITCQQVADYMCVSVRTLHRFVKAETGRSLIDLQQHIRIKHAMKLLETTTDSVTGIAYSVGFDSGSTFCTVFRKARGVTPLKYRQLLLSEKNGIYLLQ